MNELLSLVFLYGGLLENGLVGQNSCCVVVVCCFGPMRTVSQDTSPPSAVYERDSWDGIAVVCNNCIYGYLQGQ